MSDEFEKLNTEEKIKAENEFLKMKMMLEHGADFYISNEGPPEIENDFLRYVMAFEKQHANPVYTTVFKKIGSPTHFKPVISISEADIETEYEKLMDYMNEHGVDLACCSPNISVRELYRFTIEELFDKEIADINVPGMMSSFIYDEFYPDHEYDNSRVAIDECITYIFSKKPFEFMGHFDKIDLQLNDRCGLSEKDFQSVINRFKDVFIEIDLRYAEVESCEFSKEHCYVRGKYGVDLTNPPDKISIDDHWVVELRYIKDYGYWYIVNVQLYGLKI
ncbi:MAG: hypothetical protein JST75_00905 [Bacteroidetes bacterium]|nr:hypothetical protein [Bacteroidota bacterium]